MKAIIEFDLNDPDDRNAYDLHNKALDMGLILWEIVFNKRKEISKAKDPVDHFYTWLNSELAEQGINIDKLIK